MNETIHLTGLLTIDTISEITSRIRDSIHRAKELDIYFDSYEDVDTSFLQLLVSLKKTALVKRLCIRLHKVRPEYEEAIKVIGLHYLLELVEGSWEVYHD